MSIPYFSPIYSERTTSAAGCFHLSTHFFNFGQKAHIIRYYDDFTTYVGEKLGSKPSWIGITIRVIMIATVIIPLIMLFALCIYRVSHRFRIEKPKDIHRLTQNLLISIFQKADPSSVLNLRATCKSFQGSIDNDLVLNSYLVAFKAIQQSQKEIETVSHKDTSCIRGRIIEVLGAFYPQKALLMVRRMRESEGQTLAIVSLVKTFALFDVDTALKVASLLKSETRNLALLTILKKTIVSSFQNAIQITKMITPGFELEMAKAVIIKFGMQSNPTKTSALLQKKIQDLKNFPLSPIQKADLSLYYAKIVIRSDPSKGKDAASIVYQSAKDVTVMFQRAFVLTGLIKLLAPINQKRTNLITKAALTIIEGVRKTQRLEILAKMAHAKISCYPQQAVELIEKIFLLIRETPQEIFKAKAICSIAQLVVKLKKENALDICEQLLVEGEAIQEKYPEALVNAIWAMSHFDKERALELTELVIMATQDVEKVQEKSKRLISIATLLSSFESEVAKNLAERICRQAKKLNDGDVLDSIATSLAKADPQTAFDIAMQIQKPFKKASSLAHLGKELVPDSRG